MTTKCAGRSKDDKVCDMNINTLIERFRKLRALNCNNPYDVGLDGYMWKKFITTTRPHLVAKMF